MVQVVAHAGGDDEAVEHGVGVMAAFQQYDAMAVVADQAVDIGGDAMGVGEVIAIQVAGKHTAPIAQVALVAGGLGAGKAAIDAGAGARAEAHREVAIVGRQVAALGDPHFGAGRISQGAGQAHRLGPAAAVVAFGAGHGDPADGAGLCRQGQGSQQQRRQSQPQPMPWVPERSGDAGDSWPGAVQARARMRGSDAHCPSP